MKSLRLVRPAIIGYTLFFASLIGAAEPLRPTQQSAVAEVEARHSELVEVNKAIWEFAEVGLEERRSSALLVEKLKAAGFKVRVGVADMPTAFVAEFGSGKPIIGILAEYDALPGLSQKVSPQRDPVTADAPGHGCGHSGLGTGALGAALAVKAAMEKHSLAGTVRLYGTPAEETLIGKVYMTLAGEFDELDACLHWHPSDRNDVWNGESKAAVSAKFTFAGVTAHASGSPDKGRSAARCRRADECRGELHARASEGRRPRALRHHQRRRRSERRSGQSDGLVLRPSQQSQPMSSAISPGCATLPTVRRK